MTASAELTRQLSGSAAGVNLLRREPLRRPTNQAQAQGDAIVRLVQRDHAPLRHC